MRARSSTIPNVGALNIAGNARTEIKERIRRETRHDVKKKEKEKKMGGEIEKIGKRREILAREHVHLYFRKTCCTDATDATEPREPNTTGSPLREMGIFHVRADV